MGTIGIVFIVSMGIGIGLDVTSHKNYIKCELSNDTTTAIKGFAIYIIILSHISGNIGIRLFTPLGGIGVALFLFLSGYGLSESYTKNKLQFYWIKRFIAIYPAYLFANIIAWILYGVSDTKTILLGLIFVKPVIPYGWYFQYLLLWYIIFWLAFFRGPKKRTWIIFIISSVISFCFFPEIMAEQSGSFITGVFVSMKADSILKKTEKKKVLIACILILIGILVLGIKQVDIVRSAPQIVFNGVQLMIKLPIAIGIILLLLSACINKKIKFRMFYLLGIISYELYLLHGMCINYIESASVTYIMFSLFISVIFAWLLKIINNYLGKIMRISLIESNKV